MYKPNIGYWNGTQKQYFTLYDYTVANVRRALPTARVGGPELAGGPGGNWLTSFLDHTINGTNNATNGTGAELDFISFHAKGLPTYTNASSTVPGHLSMNVSASLQNVRDAFAIISSYPSEKHKPVVIGEDDPDGCAACATPAYGYRNNLIFPSYTAAAFSRDIDLASRYGINLEGALTWAFEFDDRAYFDGLRVLATNQIDKPILNIFRMFGKLHGQRVNATSSGQISLDDILAHSVRNESDVGVLAAYNTTTRTLSAMVWNYHDDDLPKPDAQITLDVSGLDEHWGGCQKARVTHYRIDNSHSNSYTRWLEFGAPQDPTTDQIADLKTAGQLQMLGKPMYVPVRDGKVEIEFALPIHGTSLLVLEEQ
jgi:xylan 1,4-beta-xylosidase